MLEVREEEAGALPGELVVGRKFSERYGGGMMGEGDWGEARSGLGCAFAMREINGDNEPIAIAIATLRDYP
jgi:hypothetical protein